MKAPLFVRPLTESEQQQLQDALHAKEAFRLRRAQYLLASSRGLKPLEIATTYGGCQQSVRNTIRAFHQHGMDCLVPQSRRPKSAQSQLSGKALEGLQHLVEQSPRAFGKSRATWSLSLLAQVAFEEGLTAQLVSYETIRQALKRLGGNFLRAKQWISSPDSQYALKKTGESA
jgi:transposase